MIMTVTTRPRTADELIEQVRRHLHRLVRGVQELDSGEDAALDDVVSALRVLVTGGQGNQLLQQLAREAGAHVRPGRVTESVPDGEDITFGVGAVPLADGDPSGVEPRSLSRLLNMRCLVIRLESGEQLRYTWDTLVSTVANKLGAVHSDREVPVAFDVLKAYIATDAEVTAYALRHFAVLVGRCAAELLSSVGSPPAAVSLPIPAAGRAWTGDMLIRHSAGSGATYEVSFGSKGPVGITPLFSFPSLSMPGAAAPPASKRGRNDPCDCGSGLKYKRCHGA